MNLGKKRFWGKAVIFSLFAFLILSSSVNASQSRTYNVARVFVNGANGFWMKTVLPSLNPNWNNNENKINLEFWFTVNNTQETDWVEMGYHNGYGFKSDGSADTSTRINSLFIASSLGPKWSASSYSSYNWNSGQTHTMGTELTSTYVGGSTGYINTADMRSDGKVITSILGAKVAYSARIDAGLEWGTSNGASQSVSLPFSITDLNVRTPANGYKPWSNYTVSHSNDHSGVIASYNSPTNTITFN